MKVILNKDLSTLGEEGDVKDVAKGYARNYLFPRGIALPYTERIIKLFEARKVDIEARKAQKRQDAMGIKEKLEALELSITMPAGANGKLYGAVTGQTLTDELAKQGFPIERKRIEMPGNSIKSAGKYKIMVKLYENQSAEIQITIIGQVLKTETPHAPARPPRRRREENAAEGQPASQAETGSPVAAVEATETAVQEVPSSEADSSSNNTENSAAPETADGEPAEE